MGLGFNYARNWISQIINASRLGKLDLSEFHSVVDTCLLHWQVADSLVLAELIGLKYEISRITSRRRYDTRIRILRCERAYRVVALRACGFVKTRLRNNNASIIT